MTDALLEDTAHQSAGIFGKILKGGCGGVSVQTTHGDTEQSSAGEELTVSVAEAGSLEFKPCHVSEADSFIQYIPMVAVVFSPASAGNTVVDKIQL